MKSKRNDISFKIPYFISENKETGKDMSWLIRDELQFMRVA